MGLELTLVSFIFLGYPRAFRTSRSKRGTRRPGKCLTILSPPVSPCTYTLHFFLCLFLPTTNSHLHPGQFQCGQRCERCGLSSRRPEES